MISTKALGGVRVLADRLNQRKIKVEAVPGTVLGSLVGTTTTIATESGELDVVATSAVNSSSTGLLPNSHNVALDMYVQNGIEAVSRQLVIARTEVAPTQEALFNAVMNAVGEQSTAALRGYNVVERYNSPVLFDGNFIALLDDYADAKLFPVEKVLNLGDRTGNDVVELLSTGFKVTDEQIGLWVGSMGLDFFTSVWTDVFDTSHSKRVDSLNEILATDVNAALAVFLICRNLYDNPPDTDIALNVYQRAIADLRNLSANYIVQWLRTYDQQIKNGVLVNRVIGGSVVEVNPETYRTYLEQGGDVDTLFGYALSKDPLCTLQTVQAKAQQYQNLWHSNAVAVTARATQQRYADIRQHLYMAFVSHLEALDLEAVPSEQRKLWAVEFRDELQKLTDKDLLDLNDAILKLLCTTQYKNTDAYFILSRIDFHCTANPKLNAREAAAIVTIEYVTDWVAKQTKLSDV